MRIPVPALRGVFTSQQQGGFYFKYVKPHLNLPQRGRFFAFRFTKIVVFCLPACFFFSKSKPLYFLGTAVCGVQGHKTMHGDGAGFQLEHHARRRTDLPKITTRLSGFLINLTTFLLFLKKYLANHH